MTTSVGLCVFYLIPTWVENFIWTNLSVSYTFDIASRSITWVKTDINIMSRNYPRFLFSNPRNTKSKGPFVISTIEPIIICKVHKSNSHAILNNGFCETFASISVEFLRTLMQKPDGNGYGHEIKDTQMRMAYWLHFQIVEGNIKDWELDSLQDITGITAEEK